MSTLYSRPTTSLYGLTSLPANATLTPPSTSSPSPVPISALPLPTTPLSRRINAYALHTLSPSTYRHSLRVFSYGCAIARQCFPQWEMEVGSTLEETWFCCAMLHDIGTTERNIGGTRLSYEFWAGVESLKILQNADASGQSDASVDAPVGKDGEGEGVAPTEQAESIAEAIFRHQDVQKAGSITLLTRLIHMGTLMDNIGDGVEMVHRETIENVNGAYARKGWSGCFRGTVEREKGEKPYAMVSRIEGFEGLIEGNKNTGEGEGD